MNASLLGNVTASTPWHASASLGTAWHGMGTSNGRGKAGKSAIRSAPAMQWKKLERSAKERPPSYRNHDPFTLVFSFLTSALFVAFDSQNRTGGCGDRARICGSGLPFFHSAYAFPPCLNRWGKDRGLSCAACTVRCNYCTYELVPYHASGHGISQIRSDATSATLVFIPRF